MNIFRLIGDLAHLGAIIILLLKIWKTESCTGVSGKSQILFALTYTARYLDLLTSFISVYNTVMKLLFIASSFLTLYFIYFKYKATYDSNHDALRIKFLLIPVTLLSLLWNHEYTVLEVLWTWSIYLEAVAILPQLFMINKTGEAETITIQYLFALCSYRSLYILNWIYRYYVESYYDLIAIISGIVQTVLYCNFFYLYFTRIRKTMECKILENIGPDQVWTEKDLFREIGRLQDISLIKDGESPWEILVVPKFKTNHMKDTNENTIVWRIHHSISDGISMGHILHVGIADQPFTFSVDPTVGSIRKLYQKHGDYVPKIIHACPPVAILPYPDRNPHNRFSVVLSGKEIAIDRLQSVHKASKKLASSPDVLANYFAIGIMGLAPYFVIKFLAPLAHTTITFSNIPGPTHDVKVFNGDELVELGAWVPIKNRIGIGMVLFSYNDKLRVKFISDKLSLPNSEHDVELLRNYFETEVVTIAQSLGVEEDKIFT